MPPVENSIEETTEETSGEETTEETSGEETTEETTEETESSSESVETEVDPNVIEIERLRGVISAKELAATLAQGTITELREELARAYKSVPSDNDGAADAPMSDEPLDWESLVNKATSKESE